MDDLKSYVKLDDATTGLQTFKDALLSINDWSAEWQLPVSYSKCSYMLISNSNNFQPGPISFGLHNLEQVYTIKDLGVLFNNQFNFSEHITSIIVKGKQRLFLLRECFITKDANALLLAYRTYVIPIMDYCSPVWTPHHVTEI